MRHHRSLFEDERDDDFRDHHCHGSICQTLSELLWKDPLDTNNPELLLVNKGTDAPLSLGGVTSPTVFTLKRFDRDTCRAVFTYQDLAATEDVKRPYVTDCHTLAGVVYLNPRSE